MISILVIYLPKKYYHKLNKKSSIKEVNGQIKLGVNMVKEGCFAYEGYGNCIALNVMDCENCKFYKLGKYDEEKIKKEVEEYSERLKYKNIKK